MKGTTDYVMAIDLGSSKIVAGLGKKEENGELHLIALKQMPSDSEIRRGIVHNVEDVAGTVRKLKEDLSNSQTPPLVVNHVYVGINGYTLRTKDVNVYSQFAGTELFTEKELDELTDQIPENLPEDFFQINVYQQEFLVDGKLDRNPIGTTPKRVDAHFKVVGGIEDLTRKTETAFESIKLNANLVLGPVASAEAVLLSEEKSKGVVCIDFGAETTSICIYKGDMVRYVSVLPFGGRNLTLDLLQLNLDEDDAENLKLLKGTALHYSDFEGVDGEEPFTKEDQEINEIIVARIEEIVENIWAQINRSGIEPSKLLAGIVITGGASKLPDLEKLIARKTGMIVRMGDPSLYLDSVSASMFGRPEYASCIGLILQGKNGCFAIVEKEPVVEVVKPKIEQEQTLSGFDIERPIMQPKSVKEKHLKSTKTPKPPKEPKSGGIKTFFGSITEFLNNDN
ncbi:MAG TPA: cell division protein FtsA [Bacteroidales bacterium]|nr:cell division protein FtsA [Bacteroidales bacterium]